MADGNVYGDQHLFELAQLVVKITVILKILKKYKLLITVFLISLYYLNIF